MRAASDLLAHTISRPKSGVDVVELTGHLDRALHGPDKDLVDISCELVDRIEGKLPRKLRKQLEKQVKAVRAAQHRRPA